MKRFANILYVVEEASADQAAAIERAVSLAQNNQARLTLIYVTERPRLGAFSAMVRADDFEARLRQNEQERIDALLAPHRGRVETVTDVRFGTPFIEVVRDVLRNGRDLVIKAAGYGGTHAFLFGGIDQHLLRKCPCPVWIMHGEEKPNYSRIVAAVDFDPWQQAGEKDDLNRLILELACSLALSDFADLHIVHAWQSVADHMVHVFGADLSDAQIRENTAREQRANQSKLESLAGRMRDWIGADASRYLSPQLHLREGRARKVIPEFAAQVKADLVVMGTVSRTGIPGLIIGNTAEVILNNLECSVLAVKPAGFVSPVQVEA